MLTKYIQAAMRHAHYEIIGDGTFYAEIPDFDGLWANADTLEECREELQEVLEGWLLLKIADHDPLPVVDGLALVVEEAA